MQGNNGRRRFAYLKPVEVATAGYWIFLSLLVLLFHKNLHHWPFYVLVHGLGALGVVYLAKFAHYSNRKIVVYFRDWYLAFLFPLMFEEMGSLSHLIFTSSVNQMIADMDRAIFGVYPSVWLEKVVTPWLTELLMFCYLMVYILPFLFGAIVYFKIGKQVFNDLLLAIALGFYTCFIIWFFLPATGPWKAMPDLYTCILRGGIFTALVNHIQKVGGIHGGAFPSSHVSTSFIVLLFAYRYKRPIFYIFLPLILGLFFATVYCRFHYAVDVLSGLAVGGFGFYLAPKINRRVESAQ